MPTAAPVVALAGRPGSGKSTIAQQLAETLHTRTASFGDYVRHMATVRKLGSDRRTSQDLGQHLVQSDLKGFIAGFLEWAGPEPNLPLIIDGLRHIDVDDELRAWTAHLGRPYHVFVVEASEKTRAMRRTGGNLEALAQIDAHSVEADTAKALVTRAEVVVDGEASLDRVIAIIIQRISSRRAD